MAGLVGAGRTELAEALFGLRPITARRGPLDGRPLVVAAPGGRDRGRACCWSRRTAGCTAWSSETGVGFNLSLPNLDLAQPARPGVRRPRAGRRHATCVERLRVKTPSLAQPVGLLSGGNQQKVVLGKWLARTPRVLILDEPTRGVDVGARSEIYALMDELAGRRAWPSG